jgi:CubicO group peptidase (beta-lactamase class C family)
VVLFNPFVRVGAYKGGLAVNESVAALINEVARTKPGIVTSFGNPYILGQFPDVSAYLIAWGQWDAPQRAAVHALTGESAVTGRLPIPIPPGVPSGAGIRIGRAPPTHDDASPSAYTGARAPSLPGASPRDVGMQPSLPGRVDEILQTALAEGASPGAAVAIGRHGRLVVLRGYGRLDTRPGFAPVTDSSIYDLASLTKVIGTTTAVMMLVDEGKVDLDARVSKYIPEWQGSSEKEKVTVRDLLVHDAGLPAFGPLYLDSRGKAAFLERIAAAPLEYTPRTKMVYSDYGAIMLGFIVERVSGQSIDRFLQQRVFGPLGMRDTGYDPPSWTAGTGDPAAAADAWVRLRARIAPTEIDTTFRMAHVHGRVHDENAFALGGVAGHAGLFSSARDLAVFAQMLLGGGSYGGQRLIDEKVVREFTRRQSDLSSRALGWDTPSERSSAGDWFTAASFGHTGFTGTSIWMDPERDVFVVLLTNRVDPTRDNQRHIALRRDLADAVQKAITDMPVSIRRD